jgi:hypothetical protein
VLRIERVILGREVVFVLGIVVRIPLAVTLLTLVSILGDGRAPPVSSRRASSTIVLIVAALVHVVGMV